MNRGTLYPHSVEWALEFCIQKNYIESAQYLVSLGLPFEELNCGLEKILKKKRITGYVELIKSILKAGASVKSCMWLIKFSERHQHEPEQNAEVLRSLCTTPSEPAFRYHILGMLLHYCCLWSGRCQWSQYLGHCTERIGYAANNMFNMTWYKTLEFLISEGLDVRSFKDEKVIDSVRDYYGFCHTCPKFVTPHIDTSVLSIMIRLSTGSTLSKIIFAEYVDYSSQMSRRYSDKRLNPDIIRHKQDLLDLLPMFYHVGVPVCESTLMFAGYMDDHYLSYLAAVKDRPRTLMNLACLRVRAALSGPNVLCSSQALAGVPTRIREIITFKNLDTTNLLEPEGVI